MKLRPSAGVYADGQLVCWVLGKVPFIQIVESNEMSPGLAEKCGFIKAGKCTWMGLELE